MNSPSNKKTYAERIQSKIENSMKLKDTDRYENKGLGDSDKKKHILSGQLKDNTASLNAHHSEDSIAGATSFYINSDALTGKNRDNGENISDQTHVSYGSSYIVKAHDKVIGGTNDSYEQRKLSKTEDSLKLSDTEHYVNKGIGNASIKEEKLSGQLKENTASVNTHNREESTAGAASFYINSDFLMGRSRDSGENISGQTPVSCGSSYISRAHDNAVGGTNDSYEQRKLSKTEDNLKLSDTEHYANNGVGNVGMKEEILAGQLKGSTLSPGIESYISLVPTDLPKKVHVKSPHITEGFISNISHEQWEKFRTKHEKKKSSAKSEKKERAKLEKEAVKYQKALNNAEIKFNKQKIKHLKKEKNEIGKEDGKSGKSQNVIGKGATAIRQSADIVKNVTNDIQDNKTSDDVIMERSYAMAGAVAKGAGTLTKGLVKATVSVASIEARHKISSNRAEKHAIKEQIKEIKGVNKTLKRDSPKLYATHGHSDNETIKKNIKYYKERKKDIDKQRKQGKADANNKKADKKANRKAEAKANEKANRNAYIKDYTRKKIISGLIKPESDKENNMSTGFGSFVAGIAKRYMDDFFKGLVKWFLGIIGQVILTIVSTLLSVVIFMMPVILPVGAVVAVICGLFGFLFGDISGEQANELYCVNVLNEYYNDFNQASYDWLLKNKGNTTGYKVVYADDCSKVDNFQDALLLYVALSADNLSDGTSDGSYLVVDTYAEVQAMNKAFSMLTYAEVSGKVRNVHRFTLADVESQLSLSDSQKEMLELEKSLIADSSGLNLGERTPGKYSDDIGVLPASEKAQVAVNFALSKLGCPYSHGFRNDGLHFDCSSLVYYAWLEAGINISPNLIGNAGTTETEAKYFEEAGQIVNINDYSELLPGDLIFLSPYQATANYGYKNITHVVMYIGNNLVVHAPQEGDVVNISPIYWDSSQFVEVARPQ
jgi:hypothetical protein